MSGSGPAMPARDRLTGTPARELVAAAPGEWDPIRFAAFVVNG
ncbi:hypothetical protein [Streptomyces sp. NPDC018947]